MPPVGHKQSRQVVAQKLAVRRDLAVFLVALLAPAFLGVGAGCTVDLRPDEMKTHGVSESAEERGRKLLEAIPEAHGGLERWRKHRTAQVTLRDDWPGWLTRTAAMPWFDNAQLLTLTTLLGTDNARIEFMEEPNKGLQWGIQDWVTYTVPPGGRPIFEEDSTITFWVPTVTYFFEAPFRLREADVVAWIGDETIDGRTYDKVFLSWGEAAPQDDTDQYVAWVDRETGRLSFLGYTVRDMMNSVEGFMHYSDYEEFDGIWVAKTMAVVESAETTEAGLHRMDVESVEFGVATPTSYFYLDPKRSGSKHD